VGGLASCWPGECRALMRCLYHPPPARQPSHRIPSHTHCPHHPTYSPPRLLATNLCRRLPQAAAGADLRGQGAGAAQRRRPRAVVPRLWALRLAAQAGGVAGAPRRAARHRGGHAALWVGVVCRAVQCCVSLCCACCAWWGCKVLFANQRPACTCPPFCDLCYSRCNPCTPNDPQPA